ncbi:MAG: hypothetical protein VX278_23320, partial [Myxococcota bacterium]|nr:hypothetical protein [Myxococcota bacterium]
MNIFLMLISSAFAEDLLSVADAFSQGQTSFSELSDISLNVTKKLELANRSKDLEKVKCISARHTSIAALLDISKQSLGVLGKKNMKPIMADVELKKIQVSLSKAQQYSNEVQNCLQSKRAEKDGNKTLVSVDQSAVLELLAIDESSFARTEIENLISEMSSNTSTTSIEDP